MPERPKGADCKSAGYAYGGSNPSPPTGCGNLAPPSPLSSAVEHFHGKEGVRGSIPRGGSDDAVRRHVAVCRDRAA